jgi:hypothetical protein
MNQLTFYLMAATRSGPHFYMAAAEHFRWFHISMADVLDTPRSSAL